MAFIAVSFVLRTITGRYSELYQDSEHARGALLESLTQVEEARDEALRANQTKSTFLANMSHELRTPLNAIMGYAELLGEEFEEDDDPRFGDTEKIRSAGTHLLKLIDELLDLSKLESGRLELALDHHSLEDELLYLSSMTVPLAAKNNNKWEYHMSPILLGKRFTFDALRLRQCLINLIGNAAKFTYDGSIKLDVQLQEDGPQPMIQLAVIDTGIGMTKEQCENVFNPFWQADASSTRKVGGVGLGMALTHRLIERMGGFVTVESEPGVGTTFTIFLPAAIEHSIISADDSLMTDDSLVYGIEATA
jgi:signal transduction histidine kinase